MIAKLTVKDAIQFRDAVAKFALDDVPVYARLDGFEAPTFHIIYGHRGITLKDMFSSPYPPIQMEEFASALWRAERNGEEVPVVNVFTLR